MLKKPFANSKKHIDYYLLIAVSLLVAAGILFVYSASFYVAEKQFGNKFFFVFKQLTGAALGALVCWILANLKLDKLQKRYALPLLGISIVLLGLVFIPGIGVESYGAKRWIGLGSFTFQPSELAKFAFVIYSAGVLSSDKHKNGSLKKSLPVLLAGTVVCLLVILEPNMSITVCIGLTMLAMLYVGGLKLKYFVAILIPVLLLVPLLIIMEPYRLLRLLAFLDPWASPKEEGYQLIQSFFALGNGGWFGVGLFNSTQKLQFLPFAESDFILAVIGEEIGFVGCSLLLLIYLFVVYRGIKIALNAPSLYYSLLAYGIVSIIAIQTLINVAVVTGSIPPTGLPLPFISCGSSSLIVFLGGIGILLNISKQT